MKLFSTEQVSRWHPDKMADQVSDAIVTECLKRDSTAHVAVECLLKDKLCVLAGEISIKCYIDVKSIALRKLDQLEPNKSYIVIEHISRQSPEINEAVSHGEDQGAGDQGMMFGYATSETESMLPYGFELANKIIKRIEASRGGILKGDAKCQVTVDLDKKGPDSVNLVLISVCHKATYSIAAVRDYIKGLFPEYEGKLLINPAGAWTIGGPDADAGVTGRKIVADQYGGYFPVGGGAFSGKDPSKVDRSATYMARYLAKDLVKHFKLKECSVQIAYAIGVAEPVSLDIGTGKGPEMDEKAYQYVKDNYDLRPKAIIEKLDLLHKDYAALASGCHFYND